MTYVSKTKSLKYQKKDKPNKSANTQSTNKADLYPAFSLIPPCIIAPRFTDCSPDNCANQHDDAKDNDSPPWYVVLHQCYLSPLTDLFNNELDPIPLALSYMRSVSNCYYTAKVSYKSEIQGIIRHPSTDISSSRLILSAKAALSLVGNHLLSAGRRTCA